MSISEGPHLSVKTKLKQGKTVIGTWCEIPSAESISVLAASGLDFVIIDMEHGSMDFQSASHMVMAAQAGGCSPLVRVSANSESDILRALDTDAEGVVVPHVENLADAKRAVSAIKFPPQGNRSLNPYTRAGKYHMSQNFTASKNSQTTIILIIEGEEGIANIEEILKLPEVDVIYIGTYDLSAALGIPGQTQNPRIRAYLKKLSQTVLRHKKHLGCMFHTLSELKFFQKINAQFLCYKVDTSVMYDQYNHIISLTRSSYEKNH